MTRRSPVPPAARLAVPLVVASLAVGACTDGGGDITSVLSGRAGGDRPGQAPPMPEDVAATFDHAIDATRSVHSVDVSIVFVAGFDSAGFEGELAADGTGHVRGATSGEEGEVELRSDGETAWLRVDRPEVARELPDGVRWIRGRYDELRDAGALQDLEQTWDLLPLLRGVGSVEDLGVEEVEGVPVRMLRGEVDLDAARDAASDEERAGLEESITVDGDVRSFVARVGLDGDGRVRSLELDVELGEMAALTMNLTLEVRAFNQAVEAPAPPPASETIDADEVPQVVEMLRDS